MEPIHLFKKEYFGMARIPKPKEEDRVKQY